MLMFKLHTVTEDHFILASKTRDYMKRNILSLSDQQTVPSPLSETAPDEAILLKRGGIENNQNKTFFCSKQICAVAKCDNCNIIKRIF